MPLKRNAMPLKRNAMPLAERYATGGTQHRRLRRNAIPMPGRGLDGPGAERYATGGTQHRRLRRNAIPMPGPWPRWPRGGTLCHWRNAIPMPGPWPRWPRGGTLCHWRNAASTAPGGTLYRCQGRGLDGLGAERYATGGTQHRRLRRNAIPMPGPWPRWPRGGTLCHWRNATSTAQVERYTDARAWPRWPERNAMPLVLVAVGSAAAGPWCSPR